MSWGIGGIYMYCVYCGKKIPDEAKFCPSCGHSIQVSDNHGIKENVAQEKTEESLHQEKSESMNLNKRVEKSDPFQNLKVDEEVYSAVQKKSTIGSLIIIAVIVALNVAVFVGYKAYAVMTRNVITLSSFTPAYTVDGSTASLDLSNSYYTLKGSRNQTQAKSIKLSVDDFTFSKTDDLQNGDQVTVKINQFENKEKNYVVKGSKTFTVKFTEETNGSEKKDTSDQTTEITSHSTSDDYMFENSSTTLLTDDDLNTLTKKWQARVAINEIYARHGYSFSNSTIADYFRNKNWYVEDSSITTDEDANLNDIEKANLKKLKNYCTEQGWTWDISDPLNTDE